MHLLSRAWEKTDYKTNMAIRINRNKEGLSASEAFHHHETQLMKDPVTPMLLADHKYVVLYVV